MWLEPLERSKIHLKVLFGKHAFQFLTCLAGTFAKGTRVL